MRTAVVTGASRGIGSEFVVRLLMMVGGYMLVTGLISID